ncbi:unnamed protein product [Symbiodinium natans]|uniref:Uncharacterized protein n=1 Tax=Symbiodinium natans TaxID=878477 RepID=A0A812N8C1_9DINO|nr:unnamed protein product [Symbiodinium natans]
MFALAALAALCLEVAVGDCPSWGKPFPSNLAGLDKISYADFFDVTYYDQYKVLEYSPVLSMYSSTWHPDPALKGTSVPPIVLYQCGTTKPTTSSPGVPSNARFFEIPVKKATVGSAVPLPFMELLGVTQSIDLLDISLTSSPCMQLMAQCFPEMHMKTSNATWSTRANQTDLLFTDAFGAGYFGDAQKDVPFQISLDRGTLDRAEWVKFMALFYNEEEQAEHIFEQVKADYNALKTIGNQLRTDASTQYNGEQPKAIFVTQWGGKNVINNAIYKSRFIDDAGAQVVSLPATAPKNCTFASNNDGSKTMSCDIGDGDAGFKSILAEADVIIDEFSLWPTHAASAYPGFGTVYNVTPQEVPALARNPPNIFRVDGYISDPFEDGTVGMGWFDIQQSEPQQTLAGLMEAIWDADFTSTCGQKYIRRASDNNAQQVVSHSDCPLVDSLGHCERIHGRASSPPMCSPGKVFEPFETTTTTTGQVEASAACGVGMFVALVLAPFLPAF